MGTCKIPWALLVTRLLRHIVLNKNWNCKGILDVKLLFFEQVIRPFLCAPHKAEAGALNSIP